MKRTDVNYIKRGYTSSQKYENMLPFISLVSLALVTLVRGTLYNRFEDVPSHSPFDFVIIGGNFPTLHSDQVRSNISNTGGTAGNALANRLTENPLFNVLVLEAGPSYVCLMHIYHYS